MSPASVYVPGQQPRRRILRIMRKNVQIRELLYELKKCTFENFKPVHTHTHTHVTRKTDVN